MPSLRGWTTIQKLYHDARSVLQLFTQVRTGTGLFPWFDLLELWIHGHHNDNGLYGSTLWSGYLEPASCPVSGGLLSFDAADSVPICTVLVAGDGLLL